MTSKLKFRDYVELFANRRVGVMLFLGFSSGLPFALIATALQAWYTDAHIDVETIGLLTLVGMPYLWKFVWAPVMDRYVPSILGRRRGWMLVTQIALALAIAAMAFMNPAAAPLGLAAVALLVAFLSASQDIAFNAYMTDVLRARERGVGVAVQTWGYRGAMFVSGGLALILAAAIGWRGSFLIMAGLMGIGIAATLVAPNPENPPAPPRRLRTAVIEPLAEILSRRNIAGLLALVVLYKLGDSFASSLTTTFLLRGMGFSQTLIGGSYKAVAIGTTIVGVLFGGGLLARLGLFRGMLTFGCLQALAILGYMALALVGKSLPLLFLALILEHFAWGMGTAALLSLLMALCNHRYTATQFALLTALDSVGRVFAGPAAGQIENALGWAGFYLVSALIALPGLVLLWLLRERINGMDRNTAAEAAPPKAASRASPGAQLPSR